MKTLKSRAGFELAGESNTGLVRQHNEDAYIIAATPERRTALLAVADGVGGYRHGEVASFLICRELGRAYESSCDAALATSQAAEKFLYDVVRKVNDQIYERNLKEYTPKPMSSTVNAVILTPDFATLINVGDSRLYRCSEHKFEQLSCDHTLYNDPEFHCRSELRRKFKLNNVISRSVGFQKIFRPEILTFMRVSGERFLLCTDGIYRDVPANRIERIMQNSESADQVVDRLVRQVLISGATDNFSVISATPWAAGAEHIQ